MSFHHLCCFCLVLCGFIVLGARCEALNNAREVNSNEVVEKPFTWLKSAQDIVSSPAGHVVVQMAKELLNRSAGNSQVLSLNLTNLFIIILLKVLIFSAALLGAGHWSGGYGYGYARSTDSGGFNFGLNEGEGHLITGFLAAQGAGIDDCLYAAACASPTMAYEYARAGRALLLGLKNFEGSALNEPRYNDLVALVEQGAHEGFRGMPCNTTIKCDGLL